MVKGEACVDDSKNFGLYAELIAEEFAKQRGIPTAHYDLVKFINEEGILTYGVLSESVVDLEKGEVLRSLRSFIGDEEDNGFGEGYDNITSLDYVLDTLPDVLYDSGYDDEQVGMILTDLQKRFIDGLETVHTDNHTENIAFIEWMENGKKKIRLAPQFDCESTFLLDINEETLNKLLEDYVGFRDSVDIADPRIGTVESKKVGGYESLWKDSLIELCFDETVRDYFDDCRDMPVDMDAVFEAVEKRIGTSLPDVVKTVSRTAYSIRRDAMDRAIASSSVRVTCR